MNRLFNLSFMLIVFFSCTHPTANQPDTPADDLTGSDSLQLVLPGIINTGFYTRDLTMTPDQKELYFSVQIGGFNYAYILYSKFEQGKWTSPEVLEALNKLQFKYLEPYVSPNGKQLFYVSNEQTDSSQSNNMDIWVMNRNGDWWDAPQKLPAVINSEHSEFFPSLTQDGTIYFTREDQQVGRNLICRSRLINGEYQPVEILPELLHIGRDRYNATIAPDESFLIIPAYGLPDSYRRTDYYISFRNEQDQWSVPQNMGPKINSNSGEEYSASLSPDGNTIYFMSSKVSKPQTPTISYKDLQEIYTNPANGKANVYMLNTQFISELKQKAQYPQ